MVPFTALVGTGTGGASAPRRLISVRAAGSRITPRRSSFSSATRQLIALGRPWLSFHASQLATRRDSSARVISGSRASTVPIRSNTSSPNFRPHTHMERMVHENLASASLGLMGHDQPPGQGEGLEELALF